MNNLQLPHAKLLYLVAELWKSQEISDSEKTLLKEMIIGDEPKLFEILEEYEENSNEEQLKEKILNIVRPKEETNMVIVVGTRNHEPPEQDEASSPLGTQLFDKKKKHHGVNELQGLANALKPTN